MLGHIGLASGPNAQLQRGRDSSVAEIDLGRPNANKHLRQLSYGAATLQSRKWPVPARGGMTQSALLQWGRDFFMSREMPFRPTARPSGRSASMGPRLFSRGNGRIVTAKRWRMNALMGPRLFSRGNPPKRDAGSNSPTSALMGPRLFSRGNVWTGCHDNNGYGASMGPRLFSRGNANRLAHGCLHLGRFNGAATLQSRKCPIRRARPRPARKASMGPRLFSRGNEALRPVACSSS